MNTKLISGIVIGALVLGIIYLFYSSAPIISAQGSAVMRVSPDITTVQILIETRNLSAQEAQEANSIISDRVKIALLAQGIPNEDIVLSSYSSYPDYSWDDGIQRSRGFVVSQIISVKLDSFEKVPSVTDAAFSSGAIVSSIYFELSEEEQSTLKREVLKEASIDARLKAESIAEGFGKSLGGLVAIETQDFGYPGPLVYYARESAAVDGSAGGSFDAEEQRVRSSVSSLSPQEIEVNAYIVARYRVLPF